MSSARSILKHLYKEGRMTDYQYKRIDRCLKERPKGEWINHRNDYGHNIADCSLCGKAMQWHDEDEDGIPRYCWYCGAEMKKEEDNHPFIALKNCPSCGNCMWGYENNDKIVCAICGYIAERSNKNG